MPAPRDIIDLQPGQRRLSATNENTAKDAIRRLLRLQFNPAHFSVENFTVSLAKQPRPGTPGAVTLPPWWPTGTFIPADPDADPAVEAHFTIRIEPSTINNIIPRLTWADAATVIGHPDGTGDIEVDPFETGILYAACAFTAGVINEVTLHKTTEPDPPADTSSVFHIVTHFYIADETTIYARPMYRSGIKAIQCGDPEAEPPVIDWRW